MDGDRLHRLRGNPLDTVQVTGETLPLGGARLLAPVEPCRIFAVIGGLVGPEPAGPPADGPLVVPKVVSRATGPGDDIEFPPGVASLWAEAEVALVVGRRLRDADADEAAGAIWGYTCCNDVTTPDRFPEFTEAKSFDTFAVIGPWVRTDLTGSAVARGLDVVCRVNGVTVGRGSTSDYRHPPHEVVRHLSRRCTLLPGDVVTLGTPAPVEVRPGDQVEVEVEEIGVLWNRVVAR